MHMGSHADHWWGVSELLFEGPQAGLEIISMQRWHFGTTYQIVARPTRSN